MYFEPGLSPPLSFFPGLSKAILSNAMIANAMLANAMIANILFANDGNPPHTPAALCDKLHMVWHKRLLGAITM
jgi:hypothetical protein